MNTCLKKSVSDCPTDSGSVRVNDTRIIRVHDICRYFLKRFDLSFILVSIGLVSVSQSRASHPVAGFGLFAGIGL